MYENVLLPTDGSEEAVPAIDHGLALASRFGATVHALSVVDLPYAREDFRDESAWADVYEVEEREAERAVEAVETRARETDADLRVVSAVPHGSPTRVILEYVDDNDVDLVAMGTHGRSRLRRFFLGSTTDGVVRASPAPVLTLRRGTETPRTAYEDVLVATDGTPGSTRATAQAVDIAAAYGATLHVAYVVETRHARSVALREFLGQQGERELDRVRARAAGEGVRCSTALLDGVPHEELLAHAAGEGVDLVVVGTHGRSGVERLAVGSVAMRVVQASDLPVLTVRTLDA
ncbi:universal stress protein [Halomarina ordinaria]|uniref:Universal stress protein n=1 Tax=Halomarina ordinaria TaxID=3033939 RepID=A0ABD5UCV3_9EURY|nr:universal stress protein [Halomarina sp. PSRA2]